MFLPLGMSVDHLIGAPTRQIGSLHTVQYGSVRRGEVGVSNQRCLLVLLDRFILWSNRLLQPREHLKSLPVYLVEEKLNTIVVFLQPFEERCVFAFDRLLYDGLPVHFRGFMSSKKCSEATSTNHIDRFDDTGFFNLSYQ